MTIPRELVEEIIAAVIKIKKEEEKEAERKLREYTALLAVRKGTIEQTSKELNGELLAEVIPLIENCN